MKTLDPNMTPDNVYGEVWVSMSPYSQSPYGNSPINEYAHWGGYIPQGLPSESLSQMPPPQQPESGTPTHAMIHPAPAPMPHHQHHHHQQLPMLNTTWPSQLTNPTPSGSYSAPPLSVTPVSSVPASDTPKSAAPLDKSRKTLSAEQKRAMCQYSEDNPGVRQMDIGRKFGVERSTVSKVLRQKDQYLKRDQENNSAAKVGKGKHPDFDRTLSNFVRRQQQKGIEVKDEDILKHAKLFARASDNHKCDINKLSASWLKNFKRKHGIGRGRLMRRASDTNIPDSARMSTARTKSSKDDYSTDASPMSPTTHMSPLSEGGSDDDMVNEGLGLDLSYRPEASQSTTSLNDDANNPFFSGGTLSPTGTFTFSPDPNAGGFTVDRQMQLGSTDGHHREKRSNTFPSLNIDSLSHRPSLDPTTPRHLSSAAASSAIDSPASFPTDTLTSPPTLHRTSSKSRLAARSTATPGTFTASPMDSSSSPVSPSHEDARRAANTLLSYIQSMGFNGQVGQGEYMALVQLTQRLQMNQTARGSVGSLSRIPEGDGEISAGVLIPAEVKRESQ